MRDPAGGGVDITQLLQNWGRDPRQGVDQLFGAVHDELRRLARAYMRRERPDHTLQATALVHEAFLRLVDQDRVDWQSRSHFFGIAAQCMRRILVDHARRRRADKRGTPVKGVALDELMATHQWNVEDVLAVDEALDRLAALDPRQAQIVSLRYFAGLTIAETAAVTGVAPATVKREWEAARTWLKRQLESRPLES